MKQKAAPTEERPSRKPDPRLPDLSSLSRLVLDATLDLEFTPGSLTAFTRVFGQAASWPKKRQQRCLEKLIQRALIAEETFEHPTKRRHALVFAELNENPCWIILNLQHQGDGYYTVVSVHMHTPKQYSEAMQEMLALEDAAEDDDE